MKKASLQDIKKNNRGLIMQAMIDKASLSRIEIAKDTGLSPSTVTTLVSELLDDNILVETGEEVFTGGRRRKELAINPDYGVISVVEVGRTGASIHFFDMLLRKAGERVISARYISGNDLLIGITSAVFDYLGAGNLRQGYLAGVGLLFQEDMQESEFGVMYSTSLSSDIISLREALFSQFQVPVLEEYSMGYSISEAMGAASGGQAAKNSVHISIANSVLASVTINGKSLPMKDGKSANLTAIMQGFDKAIPEMAAGADAPPVHSSSLADRVAALIALMCSMFSLDVIFLSGNRARSTGFVRMVSDALGRIMTEERPPPIRAVKTPQDEFASHLAARIRKNILMAG